MQPILTEPFEKSINAQRLSALKGARLKEKNTGGKTVIASRNSKPIWMCRTGPANFQPDTCIYKYKLLVSINTSYLYYFIQNFIDKYN
jgi:hypothetical protein